MNPSLLTRAILATVSEAMTMFLIFSPLIERQCVHLRHDAFLFCCTLLNNILTPLVREGLTRKKKESVNFHTFYIFLFQN